MEERAIFSHASVFLFTSLKNLSALLYRTGYNLTDYASNLSTDVIASSILLVILSAKVWVKVTGDWLKGLSLCLCLCRPVLTSENCDISVSISTSRHKKKKLVRFSHGYGYAYVAGVLTCFNAYFMLVLVLVLMLMH